MTSLSAIDVGRLTFWREIRARAPLLLVLLGCLVLDIALPIRSRGPWELFALLVVFPPVAVGLALRFPATADSFWRGLGGPGWVRGVVTAVVHLVPLLITAGLLLGSLHGRGESLSDVVDLPMLSQLYLATLTAIWAVVFAGRAVAGGMEALSLALATGPALWFVTLGAQYIAKWPTWIGLLWRVGALAVVAVLCGITLEGALGTWGGAVRKRGRAVWALPALLAGLLAASLAAEAAWPASLASSDGRWVDLAPDGSSAIMGWHEKGSAAVNRLLRWTPEDGVAWWVEQPPGAVEPGPMGALLVDDEITWPNGTVTTCENTRGVHAWAPDGGAALLRIGSGRSQSWRALATPTQCTHLPKETGSIGLRPGGEMVFVRDNGLFIGTSVTGARRIPVPGHDPATGRLWVHSYNRNTHVVRTVGERRTVWLLDGHELIELMEAEGAVRIHPPEGGCITASERGHRAVSCWSPKGEPLFEGYPVGGRALLALGHGWLWDVRGHELVRPQDGATVPLPVASRAAGWGDTVLLGPERVRYAALDGQIEDIALPR